jgi:hypothetical protein
MNTQELDTQPWYQQFWPWFLIALPLTAVIASFTTLYIAVTNAPELVIEDYTRIAEISAAQLDRDRQATKFDLRATVSFSASHDPALQLVTVSLSGNSAATLPAVLTLKTVHSTVAERDTSTTLTGSAGHYSGEMVLLTGTYNLHIEDPERSWKLSARSFGQPATLQLVSLPAIAMNHPQ